MLSSQNAMTYGLTKHQNEIVRTHLIHLHCTLKQADLAADLMTSGYFISILNQRGLDDRAVMDLIEYYTEVDGNLTENIFITEQKNALTDAAHAVIFRSFDELETVLDEVLQKAYKKAKAEENTIRNMSDVMSILSRIKKNPGVSTSHLSQLTNRNTSAVKRFIEALRVMGAVIEYDTQTKGWILHKEPPALLDDMT